MPGVKCKMPASQEGAKLPEDSEIVTATVREVNRTFDFTLEELIKSHQGLRV